MCLALLGHVGIFVGILYCVTNEEITGSLGSCGHGVMGTHCCSSVLLLHSDFIGIFALLMHLWESLCSQKEDSNFKRNLQI